MLRRLVATWGNADHGRLGHGALPSQILPRVVAALGGTDIAAVSAGGAHTAALAGAASNAPLNASIILLPQ